MLNSENMKYILQVEYPAMKKNIFGELHITLHLMGSIQILYSFIKTSCQPSLGASLLTFFSSAFAQH